MSGPAPLDGATVLEISSFVAAPLGGLTLAQLGADVIRIDPVGGGADLNRWALAQSGTSLYWTRSNKCKRSVTLNSRDPDGRRILGDLLAVASRGDPGRRIFSRTQLDQLAATEGVHLAKLLACRAEQTP
jgi:crotonobetainyl-CoA:carnitine CoA-transferase CaiB-like acyl-CoA transferase